MADRTVKVTAILQAQQYIQGLEQMRRKTRETAADGKASLEDQRAAYQELGSSALAFGAVSATAVALAISKFADFDAAMSNVQASTHESTENMALLRDAALQAGADTAFSATEAANAIDELSKAGLSTADVMSGGLTGALDLAAAGGLGVARAAEISATALSQFQLTGADAAHVADVLAAGAGKAQGSVDDLANGLKYVGPIAQSMGVSIEETTATLALFAQQGLIGEQAGTTLRGVLSSLTAPSKAAANEIERLGIELYDSQGNFVGMNGVAGELSEAYTGMDLAARQASLGVIFGAESIVGATALYQAGAEGVDEWTTKVDDSGYAAETARIKLDNLKGDVEALGGSFETALIKSGSTANDTLRALTQTGTGLLNAYNDLPESIQATAFTLGGVAAATSLAGGAALLAVPKYAQMKLAMEAANISAGKLGRGIAVAGGAITAVSIALAGVGQYYADVSANADALAETIDKTTGRFTDGTREMVIGILEQKDAFANASRAAGISQKELVDALLEGGDAIQNIKDRLGAENTVASFFDGTGIAAGNASAAVREVEKSLGGSLEAYANAQAANEGYADAAQESAVTTLANATELELLSGKANDAETDLSALADAIRGFGSAQLDVNAATREFEASIDELTASVTENGTSLDVSTEQGRSNQAALDAIAVSAKGVAAATLERTGSEEEARAAVQRGREELIRQLGQFGITGAAADAYADNLGLIPDDVITAVGLTGVDAAEARLAYLTRNRTTSVTVVTNSPNGAAFSDARSSVGSANGNIFDYAMSATARANNALAFANGGFAPGIYAGRAGAIHKFAEQETRWEAYISGKPGQEARNLAIWEEAGKRLGAFESIDPRTLSPMTAQYTTSTVDNSRTVAPTVSLGSGNTFYSYDPAEMARQQSREMNRALRLSGLR